MLFRLCQYKYLNIILWKIVNAPWYIWNNDNHEEKVKTVADGIVRLAVNHDMRLQLLDNTTHWWDVFKKWTRAI